MIKAVFFDLDGTLVNSIADIGAALTKALNELGLPGYTTEDYLKMVGNGARKLCQRALKPDEQHLHPQLMAGYEKYYYADCCVKTVPYEGTEAMLARLHEAGLRLAVITNKPQHQADRVVHTLLPEAPLSLVLGQRENLPVKPARPMFDFACEALGVKPEEVLYCGDSDVDIRFAHSAGTLGLGCEWGFRGRKALQEAGADLLAASPAELAELALQQACAD